MGFGHVPAWDGRVSRVSILGRRSMGLEVQPDWALTLADELAILGVRLLDGDTKVFLFDAGSGVLLGALSVP